MSGEDRLFGKLFTADGDWTVFDNAFATDHNETTYAETDSAVKTVSKIIWDMGGLYEIARLHFRGIFAAFGGTTHAYNAGIAVSPDNFNWYTIEIFQNNQLMEYVRDYNINTKIRYVKLSMAMTDGTTKIMWINSIEAYAFIENMIVTDTTDEHEEEDWLVHLFNRKVNPFIGQLVK